MLKIERFARIEEELKKKGSLEIPSLSQMLGCSEETVRRDLRELESVGKLNRIRGGAYLSDKYDKTYASPLRKTLYQQEKSQMSQKAMEFIHDRDVLFLDSSTTCLTLAGLLLNSKLSLTIVTNSMMICSLTSTLDYSNVKLSNSKELGVENINNELREIFPYGEIVSIIETPYGMAFYVDRNYHNPIKPRTIWDALDVVMAGASWADFFKEPSLANLGWAALDTVSLLPILPSSAYIRKGGKLLLNVDEVKKLAKTPEGLEKIKKALKATDKASDILEAGRKLAKKYTLSDSVYRDHIVKLHSFYSKEKNKSKFIKNFDIKKAIKETLIDSILKQAQFAK